MIVNTRDFPSVGPLAHAVACRLWKRGLRLLSECTPDAMSGFGRLASERGGTRAAFRDRGALERARRLGQQIMAAWKDSLARLPPKNSRLRTCMPLVLGSARGSCRRSRGRTACWCWPRTGRSPPFGRSCRRLARRQVLGLNVDGAGGVAGRLAMHDDRVRPTRQVAVHGQS